MSTVTKRERADTETTEPTLSGNYVTIDYTQFRWRCDGCGLVWAKRHLAEECESRKHVALWQDGPYGVYINSYGKPTPGHYYPRQAIRREKVAHVVTLADVKAVESGRFRFNRDGKPVTVPVVDRMGPGAQRLRAKAAARNTGR